MIRYDDGRYLPDDPQQNALDQALGGSYASPVPAAGGRQRNAPAAAAPNQARRRANAVGGIPAAQAQAPQTASQAPSAGDSLDAASQLQGSQAPPAQAARPTGDVMSILRKHQYGAQGLLDAEQELGGLGVQIQKDSSGRARGRLKLQNGDIVDVIGTGEGNDWWNNQTASDWGWLNRGQDGLDAGGWSFGSPQGRALQGALGFQSQNRGDEFGGLGSIASNNTQTGGDALQAIYQILGGLGPGGLSGILRGL